MYTRAGEPKKLVVLAGVGHYEVYGVPPRDGRDAHLVPRAPASAVNLLKIF